MLLLLTPFDGFDPMGKGNHMVSANPISRTAFSGDGADVQKLPEAGKDITGVVRQCAREFKVDYKLILAIIKQESSFNHEALSERGAVGMMQLMPVTNAEVMQSIDLEGAEPVEGNIRAGVYYFAKLYQLFSDYPTMDRICISLAAYNAGPARIYDAQELAAYIGENPRSWSALQNILPLLSKRYYSLHQAVWSDGHPPNGYFGSWRQTVAYVDGVVKTYEAYNSR